MSSNVHISYAHLDYGEFAYHADTYRSFTDRALAESNTAQAIRLNDNLKQLLASNSVFRDQYFELRLEGPSYSEQPVVLSENEVQTIADLEHSLEK